jgi:hypothetical protein
MRRILTAVLVATTIIGLALSAPSQARAKAKAEKKLLVLCYPGGSVKSKDAEPSAQAMLRLVEKLGDWAADTFDSRFTSKASECEKWMADKPPFAIVSLGYYLSRGKSPLEPLVQPKILGKTTDTWRVMARKGTYASLDQIKGKTLGGTLLDEQDFLWKVVFQGKYGPSDFQLVPTNQALRALRSLNDREIDAVLVNDQQFRSLGSLPFAGQLEAVWTSDPLPLMGVVADTTKTTPDERKRLQKAMGAFCGHKDGKQFCELFGIQGFVPVDATAFDSVRALWK